MLTRRRAVSAAVGMLAGIAWPAAAQAADPTPQPITVGSGDGYTVVTTVTDPGQPGSSSPSTTPVAHTGGVTCTYEPDTSNPGAPGAWVPSVQHDPTTGAWFFRSCSDGSFTPVWVPNSAPATALTGAVTPGVLAARAVNYLPLPVPAVNHSPDRIGGIPETVVGIPTWWWVSPASFRVLRQTTAAGGVSATVTAIPVSTIWSPGEPGLPPLVCPGAGTPYDAALPDTAQSTNCATTYSRSSAGQPQTGPDPNDRFFTASATTTWRVTWVGSDGTAGVLPALTRTTTFPIAVAELQAVNTR